MNLYDLTEQAKELQAMLDAGEIDKVAFDDTMEGMGIYEKVENYCKVIRNFEAKAAAIKEEKDRLALKQKAAENNVKRLKDALMGYFASVHQDKLKTDMFSVSVGTSRSVAITDEKEIVDKYRIFQPDKFDKVAITADLKAGVEVAGATLVESHFVTIK